MANDLSISAVTPELLQRIHAFERAAMPLTEKTSEVDTGPLQDYYSGRLKAMR